MKPLVVYKKLGLGSTNLISMRLLMVDRAVKKFVGNYCDVLLKVTSFIFLSYFVILDN